MDNRGGRDNNIPHDLEVEHSNRFNKEGIKNVGPNTSERQCSEFPILKVGQDQC